MRNTYLALTATQVKNIADALDGAFNSEQIKGILIGLDDLGATGGGVAAATASVRGTVLRAATVGTVTSANAGGTYTAAEQTLINELKTDLNALIASLVAAGTLT